eukprot:scaffold5437_cov100-Isochrysis_galbana.AAC.1
MGRERGSDRVTVPWTKCVRGRRPSACAHRSRLSDLRTPGDRLRADPSAPPSRLSIGLPCGSAASPAAKGEAPPAACRTPTPPWEVAWPEADAASAPAPAADGAPSLGPMTCTWRRE